MITRWLKKQLIKFKAWALGILVALGLVAGGVIAATQNFSYTAATAYDDGTPMPLTDIDFTRLYCDGAMVSEEAGADGDFSVVLSLGTHTCYATHVALIASTPESAPSNTVTVVVSPSQPSAPVLN